jgi:hypothetical protein
MGKFEVGEVAVFMGGKPIEMAPGMLERIGEECEIVAPLGSSFFNGIPRYEIKLLGGRKLWCPEVGLRKRKPPAESEELIGWENLCDKMNYHPPKETINV